MNNTKIINTSNSDHSDIAKIKTQHHQIVRTILNKMSIFEPISKIPIIADNTFFTLLLLLARSIDLLKSVLW